MDKRRPTPIRAGHVGSLIRPRNLISALEAHSKGEIPAQALREIQNEAIRAVVRMQEDLGLKVVTDGEYNRHTWQTDFLLKFDNVKPVQSSFPVRFRNEKGTRDARPHMMQVIGKLSRPNPIFVDDFKFLNSVATETAKITMPSPSVMHFRGGRAAIDETAYPDIAEFYTDLARIYREEINDLVAAGCRFLQLDEVNFAYLCDPNLREEVRVNLREDPDTLPRTYATLINEAIADVPDDMTIAMHLCRGNFAGNWVAEGGYEPVADILFNEINVDVYFMEFDSPRAGSFEPLRFLPKNKMVVLGLVTTKRPDLETRDEIKRRIDQAAQFVPLEQLALSPQCGFSSGIGGNTMSIEQEIAKLELIVETAKEVWGNA